MYNLTELKRNIFDYFYKDNVDDPHIQFLISTNILNGEYFDNIDHLWGDNKELQNNKKLTPIHLNESYNRLCIISYGYACKNSRYYQDPSVLNLIIKSLNILSKYYNSKTKIIGNWWEWRIGIPYNYSLICLFTDYIDNNYKSAMNRFIKQYIKTCDLTYANLASLCRNIYIAGSILNDNSYIKTSINSSIQAFNSKSILQIKTARFLQKLYCRCKLLPYGISMFAGKEGIFDDYSFIQHTSIPYIGTYGIEIIQFAALLYKTNKNTNIKIHNDIQKQLPIWVSAYNKSIYNGEVMVMYCGRSIGEYDVKGAAYNIRKYINEIKESCGILDEIKDKHENAIISQPISDKLIYDYDNWRFAISMCSDRVAKYESFNNQNTKGWYQNLGMTYLYTPDKSYQDYIGRVSPYFLPGVTCNSHERKIVESKQPRFNYTNKDIDLLRSGSCITDRYHIASMIQVNDEYVFAKKSWFIIDDKIICIGSDLKGRNLYTTIYNDSDKIHNINNRNKYIENIGTIVSKDFDLDDTKEGIIKIDNANNSYEYSIIPIKKVNNEYPYQGLDIYYNDNTHYVYDNNNKVYLANIWKPCHISNEHYDIEIDTMCSIGLKQNNDKNIELNISDICQSNRKISIVLSGKYKCNDKNCKVKYFYKDNNTYTKLTINCKDKLGETQHFILK